MTSVKFKEHLFVKGRLDNTIEDCFRAMGQYAGIHSFQFDDAFVDACADLSQWDTANGEGTWTISSGKLQGVGTSGWQFIATIGTLPKAFVLKFYFMPDGNERGAVGVLAVDEDTHIYVAWTSTTISIVQRVVNVDTNLIVLPKARLGDREVTISVQQWDDGSCFISCWFDEAFQINTRIATYPPGRHLAVGVNGTDTAQYDDFRVAELTEVLEYITMDVGETPLNALRRAIGRRHINYYVRFDGSLRAWRPKAQSATRTLDTERLIYVTDHTIDRTGLVSHWRQVGAWETADAWDETLLYQLGHKFHKDDNPDLMTEEDCQTEADASILRTQEYAETQGAELTYSPFQEPEDRIDILGDPWLITDYDISLQAGELTSVTNLRKYVYG